MLVVQPTLHGGIGEDDGEVFCVERQVVAHVGGVNVQGFAGAG